MEEQKIFCIGFNKTGTTSLHNFFKSCGLTSIHNTEWCHYSYIKKGKEYFIDQCYSDGEQSNFVQLEKWFPNSLFILNTRTKKEWLYSRVKHVMRHNENIELSTILTKKKYGKMAKDFYADEEIAIKKWIYDRELYHKQARIYFKGRDNFLTIDVTKSDQWADELISFFDKNEFKYSLDGPVQAIHKNKRNRNDLINDQLLSKYFGIVDSLL